MQGAGCRVMRPDARVVVLNPVRKRMRKMFEELAGRAGAQV